MAISLLSHEFFQKCLSKFRQTEQVDEEVHRRIDHHQVNKVGHQPDLPEGQKQSMDQLGIAGKNCG